MKYVISPLVQFRIALKYVIKRYWDRKQYLLAESAGISAAAISNLIHNEKPISVKKMQKIAEAAGYTFENFIALGRAIHMKTPEDKLPKPSMPKITEGVQEENGSVIMHSFLKQDEEDYDLHGGWEGRSIEELTGVPKGLGMGKAVEMLANIYNSKNENLIRSTFLFLKSLNETINEAEK